MMNSDGNIPINNKEVTELWSVCKINQNGSKVAYE